MQHLADSICGRSAYIRRRENERKSSSSEFLDIESEGKKITKIEGVEQINAIPEILQLQLEFKEGDIIEKAQDDRSRVGFFIARAESKREN